MRAIFILTLVAFLVQSSQAQRSLIEGAKTYFEYNEFDSAIVRIDSAISLLIEKEADPKLAEAYLLKGMAHQAKDQFAASLDFYLRAHQEYAKYENSIASSRALSRIGNLYSEWEVPLKALEYYEKAHTLLFEAGLDTERKPLLEKIAKKEEELKAYQQAISTYEELLRLARKSPEKPEAVKVLSQISSLLVKNGQHARALAYDLEILSIQEQLNDQESIAATLNNIGYIYRYLDENKLALQYFLDAHKLLKEIHENDEFYVGDQTILVNVGLIYRSMQQSDIALNYFFEALKTKNARQHPVQMARIYNYIAFTYFDEDNLEKSELFLETAINLAELYEAQDVLIDSYKCLSEIYGHQGKHKLALDYFQQYVSLKDGLMEEQQRKQQAEIKRQQEIEQKEQEIKLLIVDQEIKDLALRELRMETQQRDRDIELLKRDQEIQKISLSNQQAQRVRTEQALRLAQTELEAEKKDNEISLLQKDKFIQSMALRQKELEEQERNKEIELLERNRALQELELVRQRNLLYFTFGAVFLLLIISFLIYRSYNANRKAKLLLQRQNEEINSQKEEISDQHVRLEESYQNIKLLGKIGSEITANLSIDKINRLVYQHVQKLIETDNFGIGLFDKHKNVLEFIDPVQKGERLPSFEIPIAQTDRLPIHCFLNKKELLINNYATDYKDFVKRKRPSMTGETAASFIYQPLVVNNKAIGVLTVQSYRQGAYDDYHLSILRTLATHIAIAVENAFAYEQIAEKSYILEKALKDLKSAQAQLIQAEKMASLGELTAGIAHEINNPINFVYAGVDGLKSSLEGLIEVLDKYDEIDKYEELEMARGLLSDIRELKSSLYFNETKQGVFEVVDAIKEGALRTSEIVNGLRNFSRLDEAELNEANIHVGIENTLVLLSPRIKESGIEVQKFYDDLAPNIHCYAGQLNQVFMNLLSNAIEAIGTNGVIKIITRNSDDFLTIKISDTGKGIPKALKNKIFEPFFTTKELGKGTGLGLSISFGIIQKHHGRIDFDSKEGSGTTFTITLPKDIT